MREIVEQNLRAFLADTSTDELKATLDAWQGVDSLHTAVDVEFGDDAGEPKDLRQVISWILRERHAAEIAENDRMVASVLNAANASYKQGQQ